MGSLTALIEEGGSYSKLQVINLLMDLSEGCLGKTGKESRLSNSTGLAVTVAIPGRTNLDGTHLQIMSVTRL
jgi:hypothetical protein